jgi:hypothetical protein
MMNIRVGKCEQILQTMDLSGLGEETVFTQSSAKPTQGVWGLAPKETAVVVISVFFQKKKQKAVAYMGIYRFQPV